MGSISPAASPHSDEVDIYINKTIHDAYTANKPLTAWPIDSLLVKDGFSGGDLDIVAVLEKRSDGWYYAEYHADGDPFYSGRPSLCIDCHSAGADQVRAFGFPK